LRKPLLLFILLISCFVSANAQLMPYGVVDTTDLKLASCEFEKDANAEVLFDHALISYKYETIIMARHKRIKIFNDNGKDNANIRIEFYGAHRDETISDVEAETINLNNKTIEYTAVDKKQIYTETTDKSRKAIIFTFPNVKPGSVLEFKYTWSTPYPYNYPDWLFQADIPCRYSEFDAGFDHQFMFHYFRNVYQRMEKDTTIKLNNDNDIHHIWALSNIKSYKTEPFMDYPEDYLECILLKRYNVRQMWGWGRVGNDLLDDDDFGKQLTEKLSNENDIINKADSIPTNEGKIAYIFNTVKKSIKWNKDDYWFTIDGVKKAWNKKIGNSTEINLILYQLLRAANVKASLVALCTRDNGKIDSNYASAGKFNRTVVYWPIDSTNYYILDATSPYNTYNNVPIDLMGLQALLIDPTVRQSRLIDIKVSSAREVIFVDGEINPDGLLEGNSQISSSAYSREKYLKKYNDLGEKKYVDEFQDKDKKLKIFSLKMDNIESDTLPLMQTFKFNYKAAEPDGDYLYFNPNVFTTFESNPFLSESRVSNIDFGCLYTYSINGRYKIPTGYRIDALPKSVNMQMPDKGITFRRILAEQDGLLVVRYIIDYKKTRYTKDEYPSIRDFYKKMYEMLNEQIVLKKS